MAVMGDQLFSALDSFGTQINEMELRTAKEELAAGATRATAVNERILKQLVQKLETQLSGAQTLFRPEFGATPRQIAAIGLPITDYGLRDTYRQRGESLGFKFQKHIPFEVEDEMPIPTARQPTDPGGLQNPHAPQSGAEFNKMMTSPEDFDIRPGDYIQVPGEEGLRRVPGG